MFYRIELWCSIVVNYILEMFEFIEKILYLCFNMLMKFYYAVFNEWNVIKIFCSD